MTKEQEVMFTKLQLINLSGFLKLLEWTRDSHMSPRCVHCEQTKEVGHMDSCDLADLISAVDLKLIRSLND